MSPRLPSPVPPVRPTLSLRQSPLYPYPWTHLPLSPTPYPFGRHTELFKDHWHRKRTLTHRTGPESRDQRHQRNGPNRGTHKDSPWIIRTDLLDECTSLWVSFWVYQGTVGRLLVLLVVRPLGPVWVVEAGRFSYPSDDDSVNKAPHTPDLTRGGQVCYFGGSTLT